jgi:hypothetical protein
LTQHDRPGRELGQPTDGAAAAVREAVRAVLADPGYKQAAERVQAEVDGLPPLAHVVDLLVRLARERQPIPAVAGGYYCSDTYERPTWERAFV